MRRFYLSGQTMTGGEATLTGGQAHHLRTVLRLKTDDPVVVFDDAGRQWKARVASIDSGLVRLIVEEELDQGGAPPLNLALAQGYLKDRKMDSLVRQLTELGVSRWLPFQSRRTIPAPQKQKLESRRQRWTKISLEALKQCRRTLPMTIDPVASFEKMVEAAAPYALKVIFWEGDGGPFPVLERNEPPAGVFVVIGPEGGLDADEVRLARSKGFYTAGLGPRILRAETAAVAVCSLMQHLLGDMC